MMGFCVNLIFHMKINYSCRDEKNKNELIREIVSEFLFLIFYHFTVDKNRNKQSLLLSDTYIAL